KGLLGLIGLAILFADTAFWSVTGVAVNLSHRSAFFGSAIEGVLAVIGVAGLVAVAGAFVAFRAPRGEGAARVVSVATVVLLVAALATSAVASRGHHSAAHAGDVRIVARHVKFVPEKIDLQAGRV